MDFFHFKRQRGYKLTSDLNCLGRIPEINSLSQELSDQTGGEFDNNDVRWVITVPAIWKMPAKQFMREAAYKVPREAPLAFPTVVVVVEYLNWSERRLLAANHQSVALVTSFC